MKTTIYFFASSCLLLIMGACGDTASSSENARVASNQATVESLSLLMQNNPQLSKATLKEIKDTAQNISVHGGLARYTMKNVSAGNMSSFNELPAELPPAELSEAKVNDTASVIDPEVAKEAQSLIDKALDEFDFMNSVEAGFKLQGIAFNAAKKAMNKFKDMKNGLDFGDKGDFFGEKMGSKINGQAFDKGNLTGEKQIPSCQEFMENPYMKFSKGLIEQVIKTNKENIKKNLSGCAEIRGSEFVQCLSDYNSFMTLINQNASCEIEDIDALFNVLNEKTQGKFEEQEQQLAKCMGEHFKACGFIEEAIKESDNAETKNEKTKIEMEIDT
ncbi:MAG: hypothetical protein KC505_06180 [Myxococcales bacterium]|nr:hypothetical protein [Myxococcales bacterium]USN51859.1 MAG: hypothetical protein H6731_05480 [Myxococcales bacterium]